jgi:hypothetical protein
VGAAAVGAVDSVAAAVVAVVVSVAVAAAVVAAASVAAAVAAVTVATAADAIATKPRLSIEPENPRAIGGSLLEPPMGHRWTPMKNSSGSLIGVHLCRIGG